ESERKGTGAPARMDRGAAVPPGARRRRAAPRPCAGPLDRRTCPATAERCLPAAADPRFQHQRSAKMRTLLLVALGAATLLPATAVRAQNIAVDDPVIRRMWQEGMENSQAYRLAQTLTD